MSANIDTMMYVNEQPWHKLGTRLTELATAEQAIVSAGLDWEVKKQPLFLEGGQKLTSHIALVRQDRGTVLGVASDRYIPIQNRHAFEFLDAVVATKEAKYDTAGSLGKGERIWLLAKLPSTTIIAKDDLLEKYLVLTNSHDGKSSCQAYFTTVRVVCANTLTISLRNAINMVSIRHTGDIFTKVNEARRVLGFAFDYFGEVDQVLGAMVGKQMTKGMVENYFDQVLNIDRTKLEEDPTSTKKLNQRDALLNLFEKGLGNDNPAVRGTLWAAYNAVTEYADHKKLVKNEDQVGSNRLKSIWFGSAAQLKQRSFDLAQTLVGVAA